MLLLLVTPSGPRGTFVTVLALLERSIIDTELLPLLAVNTLFSAASNAIAVGKAPPSPEVHLLQCWHY